MQLARKFAWLIAGVAALGLVISFGAHLASWFIEVRTAHEIVIALAFGVAVCWLPALPMAGRLSKNAPSKDVWRAMLRFCPTWLRRFLYATFAYALVNFVVIAILVAGLGAAPALFELRGSSGHLIAFYAASLAIAVSFARSGPAGARCPNGHEVSPFATYCDTCGQAVLRDNQGIQ